MLDSWCNAMVASLVVFLVKTAFLIIMLSGIWCIIHDVTFFVVVMDTNSIHS